MSYFAKRYRGTDLTQVLHFRKSEKNKCDFVTKVIRETDVENIETVDMIKALGYIVYRLRNNLFHGIKPFISLHEQNRNFMEANMILIAIIDAIKGS